MAEALLPHHPEGINRGGDTPSSPSPTPTLLQYEIFKISKVPYKLYKLYKF